MTEDFAVFMKTAKRILGHLDQEIDKLHDLLEEEDDSGTGNLDDARAAVGKLQFDYFEARRAIDKLKEDDLGEEEEDEEQEDEEEAESE